MKHIPSAPACTGFDHTCSSRRDVLMQFGMGLGGIALGNLLTENAAADGVADGEAMPLPARAKRVIFLFQSGGPSQMDLLDYKPELNRRTDSNYPKRSAKDSGLRR